jgi:UDP-3-O-[3-hydroxymyristoyl] glucosamine N-acyltransferase
MIEADATQLFWTAPESSELSEFAALGLDIVRPCSFSFAGKILTPVDDLLVPLAKRSALPDLLARTGIAGVVTTRELSGEVPEPLGLAVCDDPMRVHHEIHRALARLPGRLWSDFPSEVDPSAAVSPTAWVAPTNVVIGPGAVIMPGAVIHERTVIGAGARIHARAVVGADAYEIIIVDGQQQLRPQTGGTMIGAHCELLAGAVVTRSAFCGATVLGEGTVLDCNTVVSHDCRIGAQVRIGGASWIGGRVTIDDSAAIGPNATIGNGLRIGERASVSLGSVVTRDVAPGTRVSGNFAIDHNRMVDHMRRIR